ncbi:hypothetical protein MMYC01_205841 [Madurella mycetomatis]|uniref:Uncharacterized protein n=1 Tax=Madurella mycetomatis TaxID=100816 RepID=A0A175W203_9PEZI|nr:hypothetical protein MMYC01_205841 [Madurella mycetomatis]
MLLQSLLISALLSALGSSTPLHARLAEVDNPCGAELGDCPTLTCIPLSSNCTYFRECPGTCQDLSVEKQQIYTLCGGWQLYDDCDERIEFCTADPRHYDTCGPSCDGLGICAPIDDYCGGNTDRECGKGKACFGGHGEYVGTCFPLRFGSDYYDKSREEEVFRTDQDGRQDEEDP